MRKMIPANQGEFLQKLYVKGNGDVNGLLNIANLVDADGNPRFIEGDLTLETIDGIEFKYAKWSLSGSHFMVVIAGTASNEAAISAGKWATLNNVPLWLYNKIKILINDVVLRQNLAFFATNYATQTTIANLRKLADGVIDIYCGAITLTADREFRGQFDLLIDTEPAGE